MHTISYFNNNKKDFIKKNLYICKKHMIKDGFR